LIVKALAKLFYLNQKVDKMNNNNSSNNDYANRYIYKILNERFQYEEIIYILTGFKWEKL
jgi:hypothetical protein